MQIDLGDNGTVKFGNQKSIYASLVYGTKTELQNNFLKKGYFGDWMSTMNVLQYDFDRIEGWEKLDREMSVLFRRSSDVIRSVFYFKNLTDIMVSNMEEELRIKDIVKLNAILGDMLGIFPKDFKWYSATWEHMDESTLFFGKQETLLAETSKLLVAGIQSMKDRCIEFDKTLFPVGVIVTNKIDGNDLYRVIRRFPSNSGEFYVVDHEKKTSIKIGSYNIEADNKLKWRSEKGVDIPDGFYIVCIKK